MFKFKKTKKERYYPMKGDVFEYNSTHYEIKLVESNYIKWKNISPLADKFQEEGNMSIETYLTYVRRGAYILKNSWYSKPIS